jgi:protein farnesyltransferase/geranylgeranyltransferase type-1 subunit alpha
MDFCLELYDKSIRSPHLLACMVDVYEEMMEQGCKKKEEVLDKAVKVSMIR